MSLTFYSYNLVDYANITADSENSLFPVSNLKDDRRTKTFRSIATTANITFDMLTTEPIDSFYIVDHPKLGFGFSDLTLEGNATSNFSSPAFSTTISVNHTHGVGFKEFVSQSYRFWRLTVTGASFVDVSKVFLGSKVAPSTYGINFNWNFYDDDLSKSKTNRLGQKFTDVIGSKKKLNFSFETLNPTELAELMTIIDYNRVSRPLFIRIGDESDTIIDDEDRLGGYYYLDKIPKLVNKSFALWDLSFRLSEGL